MRVPVARVPLRQVATWNRALNSSVTCCCTQNNWRWRLGSLSTLQRLRAEAKEMRKMVERYDRLAR